MIRRDYWNSIYGRPRNGIGGGTNYAAGSWDMWARDPRSNPSLRPVTDDDRALAEAERRHTLAQKLLTRENANKAKREADMLEQLLHGNQPVNLFEEPANEFDEDLQTLIQGDVNAGIRGINMQVQEGTKRRKQGLENLNAQLRMQAAALDRAKFGDQIRRSRADQALDAAKLQQQGAYRNALLAQRSAQMRADIGKDQNAEYQREAKMALDLVKDGMDPEEVVAMFRLNDRDQQLLFSYGGMLSEEMQAEEQPYLDYLNEMELGMRSKNPLPAMNTEGERGWLPFTRGPAMQGPPVPTDHRAAYAPLPMNDEAMELRAEAAKRGYVYDPNTGFSLPGDPEPATPVPAQPARSGPRPGIPVVTNGADARRRFRPGTLVQSPTGQLFRVP